RLAIIDVAGGHQPIFNEDGTVAVVFNGEIYNYQELMRQVESRGHRFKTRSDTETIVHLYEEYGEACVQMLHGMFAFALWDARQSLMILARDRVGKKPLYFADCGGRLVFASELKAVIENPHVPRVLDREALADYFSYQYIPSPKSIFRDVRKVRAGHYLVVTSAGMRDHEYWDLDFSRIEQRSDEYWCEALRESLRQAVASRLISEAPLGAFLSGGVDSSSVVALMSRIGARPVVTATAGFEDERYSEAEDARRFAGELGTQHHERIVRPDVAGIIEKLAWHYDEPFADASAIPTYYVSQAAREVVTVALSGDGGDENFAGYRRYAFTAIENRVREMAPAALRKPLFGALAAVYPKADYLPQFLRARSTFHNISLDPPAAYFNSVYGAMARERAAIMGRDLLNDLNGYDPYLLFLDHFRRAHTDDPISRVQYVDIKTYLSDDVLAKVDRASMAVSLEVRCPLLDHRLMELAARIPSRLKLRGRSGKYIFKRALRGLLPQEILSRRKQGFVAPISHWLRGELREPAESLLFDAGAQDDLLERGAVARLWQWHQSGLRECSRPLWAILMFRMWQRKYQNGSLY
ncbi:MAG: asparagine synthase (glutamine-hydrolyzing), partial [Blastocatellia bacterium]|nr:asparagine synthase (glutamine-hydrolyzing) [Blastocatellia bacterium]